MQEFAKKNEYVFECGHADVNDFAVKNKKGIEESARILRYEFFERLHKKYSAFVCTAHHLGDMTETVIFNLLRGTKLPGIVALKEKNGYVLRPILHTTKAEILEYCQKNNIEYRTDESNADTNFMRNHIRLNILPACIKINPNYQKAIANFCDYAGETLDFINDCVQNFLQKSDTENTFNTSDFMREPPFLQKEIIRFLYEKANNGTIGLSEGNVEELRRFVCEANGGTLKVLGDLRLEKRKNVIAYFGKQNAKNNLYT